MNAKMKPRISEHNEQKMLIEWARYSRQALPELDYLFAIPNGAFYGLDGPRARAIRAKIMRAEGLMKGVPDLCLPVPSKGYHGLYIEMKAVTQGRLTDEQKKWISALNRYGYRAVVCKGFEAAKEEILKYLGTRKIMESGMSFYDLDKKVEIDACPNCGKRRKGDF